jgi:uncharacterized protein YbaA (DUF1428 family)
LLKSPLDYKRSHESTGLQTCSGVDWTINVSIVHGTVKALSCVLAFGAFSTLHSALSQGTLNWVQKQSQDAVRRGAVRDASLWVRCAYFISIHLVQQDVKRQSPQDYKSAKRPQDAKQEVRKTVNLGSKNTSQDAIHRMLSGRHFSGTIRWTHFQDAIHKMQSGMQSSGCCPQGRHAVLAPAFRAFVRVSLIGSSMTL